MPAVECQVRDGLGNVMAKIESGRPVRIAYLGGSITEMDGWRRLSREWLQAQYPACTFSETHAAIGGTGSSLGVYRVGEHVLKYDPDLVFVEFAVNDAAEAEWTIWKNFEGIVRQIWKHDPGIDIVFVYTVRDTMVSCYQSGVCPHSASAMEMLAEHYGIPSICFGPRVAADVSAGLLVMNGGYAATAVPAEDFDNEERLADIYAQQGKRLFSKDGVHPILRAHRCYYLAAIESSWPALAAPSAVDHASRLAVPFYDTAMERAKQVFPDPGLLTGSWEKLSSGWERQFGASPWFTQTPGDSFHFRFRGSACRLYCIFGNDCGQVFVTVDGVRRPEPVPLFDRDCTYYRAAVLPVFAGEEGIHEVTVELDSEQPDRSAVGSEATSNPKKYDGIRWYCGSVLLLGDLDLTPLTDPSDGSVRHVDGPHVAIGRAPREIPEANGKTSRFDAAVRFTPDRETVGAYGSWTVGIAVAFDRDMPGEGVSFRICDGRLDGATRPVDASGDWVAGEFRRIRMNSPLSFSEMVAASGIVLGALFIASVGTGAGLALGIATMINREFIQSKGKVEKLSADTMSKLLIIVVLALATALSCTPIGDTILKFAFMSMGLRGCTVFAPLCFLIWAKGRIKSGYAFWSIVGGSVVALILGVLNLFGVMTLPCDAVFPGVAVGLIVMFVGLACGKGKQTLAK